jgi:hypothetical protein
MKASKWLDKWWISFYVLWVCVLMKFCTYAYETLIRMLMCSAQMV